MRRRDPALAPEHRAILPRDVLLLGGALPLGGVVAARLAAAAGWIDDGPSGDLFWATAALFFFVFLVFVALTLRAVARDARAILSEDTPRAARPRRGAEVTDFAVHIDRRPTILLSPEEVVATPAPGRDRILGELGSRLAGIPSSRQVLVGRGSRS